MMVNQHSESKKTSQFYTPLILPEQSDFITLYQSCSFPMHRDDSQSLSPLLTPLSICKQRFAVLYLLEGKKEIVHLSGTVVLFPPMKNTVGCSEQLTTTPKSSGPWTLSQPSLSYATAMMDIFLKKNELSFK